MTARRSSSRVWGAGALLTAVIALCVPIASADDEEPPAGCEDLSACVAQSDPGPDISGEDASGDGSETDSGTTEPGDPSDQPGETPKIIIVSSVPKTSATPTTTETPDAPVDPGTSTTPVATDNGARPTSPAEAATPPPTAAPTVTAAAPPPPGYCEATPTADIGVKAKTDLTNYVVGSTVNYFVDVYVVRGGRNYCDAPDAALTFKVPPQLELLSSSSVSAPEGSCSVAGDVGSQVVTCRFESVGSDKDVLVHVSARADKSGKATAEAGVSTSSADPDTGDQSDSVSVVVTAPEAAVQPKAESVAKQAPSTPGQHRLKLPGSRTVQTTTSSKHLHPAASPPKRVLTLPSG